MVTTNQPVQKNKDETGKAVQALQSFYVKEYGVTVEAFSVEEAIDKAKKIKEDK